MRTVNQERALYKLTPVTMDDGCQFIVEWYPNEDTSLPVFVHILAGSEDVYPWLRQETIFIIEDKLCKLLEII